MTHVESTTKDITLDQVVSKLTNPDNLDILTQNFDTGETSIRDSSRMTYLEQTLILDAGTQLSETISAEARYAGMRVSRYVKSGLYSDAESDQNYGKTLLSDASTLATRGIEGAVVFAQSFNQKWGCSIESALKQIDQGNVTRSAARLVADTINRETYQTFAYFMADRAFAGEQLQEHKYGQNLIDAKRKATQAIIKLSAAHELGGVCLDRTVGQIKRTKFSSFDPLEPAKSPNDKWLGHYRTNTLRIELSPRYIEIDSRTKMTPSIVTHETIHSGSAQEDKRVGLKVSGSDEAKDANEAMTEYINQDALDFVGIDYQNGKTTAFNINAAYVFELGSIIRLKQVNPAAFSCMFRAYHGQVEEPAKLKAVLVEFKHILDRSRSKNR